MDDKRIRRHQIIRHWEIVNKILAKSINDKKQTKSAIRDAYERYLPDIYEYSNGLHDDPSEIAERLEVIREVRDIIFGGLVAAKTYLMYDAWIKHKFLGFSAAAISKFYNQLGVPVTRDIRSDETGDKWTIRDVENLIDRARRHLGKELRKANLS